MALASNQNCAAKPSSLVAVQRTLCEKRKLELHCDELYKHASPGDQSRFVDCGKPEDLCDMNDGAVETCTDSAGAALLKFWTDLKNLPGIALAGAGRIPENTQLCERDDEFKKQILGNLRPADMSDFTISKMSCADIKKFVETKIEVILHRLDERSLSLVPNADGSSPPIRLSSAEKDAISYDLARHAPFRQAACYSRPEKTRFVCKEATSLAANVATGMAAGWAMRGLGAILTETGEVAAGAVDVAESTASSAATRARPGITAKTTTSTETTTSGTDIVVGSNQDGTGATTNTGAGTNPTTNTGAGTNGTNPSTGSGTGTNGTGSSAGNRSSEPPHAAILDDLLSVHPLKAEEAAANGRLAADAKGKLARMATARARAIAHQAAKTAPDDLPESYDDIGLARSQRAYSDLHPLSGRPVSAAEIKLKGNLRGEPKTLGGGVNETSIVTLEDGTQAVWKPHVEIETSNYRAEVLAYEIDRKIRFNQVPETIERTIKGRKGSLQLFKATGAKSKITQAGLEKQDIFDYIIRNTDRLQHHNTLFGPKGEVISIDNGNSFIDHSQQALNTLSLKNKIARVFRTPEGQQSMAELRQAVTDPQFRRQVSDYLGTADADMLLERMRNVVTQFDRGI